MLLELENGSRIPIAVSENEDVSRFPEWCQRVRVFPGDHANFYRKNESTSC